MRRRIAGAAATPPAAVRLRLGGDLSCRSVTARDRPGALGWRAVSAWALAAVALLTLLHLWRGDGYWEYSDGVYALTARLLLDGRALYDAVGAAQPPPIFLFGAGALAIDDTVGFLRAAVAAVQLATSALVLVAVWRLTRGRLAAVVAALAVLVAPWTLREHAQLIPETFAAPLLLAATLAIGRAGGARRGGGEGALRAGALAGALCALASAFKVAFALPALVLLLAGARGRDARLGGLAGFAGAGLLLGAAALAAFGAPLLDGVVRAQRETGLAGLRYVGGLWAQAGWNLLPLAACAALAWPFRDRLADRDLARALAATAAGALLLLATLFKSGSYLTVVVVIEPPLLCLAAAGVVAAWRSWQAAGAAGWAVAVAAAALALGIAQVGSLLADPGDPRPFTRPFAASGPGWNLSPEEVDAAVARLRACPPGLAASGPPYLAFAAGRRMPGDQPDQFILRHAPVLGELRDRADADQPRCP